jgi:hypothetical protein
MLGWPRGGSATPAYFFFWIFFLENKICDVSILGKKNVKLVELPQFESLGGGGGGG